ncbi:MAG TPA: twin-arginine translocation signal domain-containing protein [Niabella sp.]|nr:twin-arginine translocation signal domain-containing protein [Niabella sp.]
MDSKKSTRRSFIKQTSIISAVAAALPNLLFAENSGIRLAAPSERINLACVGIGNRAGEIIEEFYKTGLVNIVALCDVDMGAAHT